MGILDTSEKGGDSSTSESGILDTSEKGGDSRHACEMRVGILDMCEKMVGIPDTLQEGGDSRHMRRRCGF